ncbi:hypothetical protein N7495_000131 [Penicillium taxi]|uniref:uncharacterized protein n=1 Tax=Penicillium taxi TaxID=168475 RepID=UPI0025451FD6|nr:uncharacterized protein N7495_000131 [Penicillium taxi]KAJ5907449.1 hypothetical protein N7495_000131 [Penicillium taxi]
MSALRCRQTRLIGSLRHGTTTLQAPRTRIISPQHTLEKRGISYSSTRPQTSNTTPTSATSRSAYSPKQSNPTLSTSTSTSTIKPTSKQTTEDISKSGLDDKPLDLESSTEDKINWSHSFHGLSTEPFSKEIADVLLADVVAEDVEVKPDGIIYLPEIKYRRILNRAFGPGGWGLAPRGESIVTPKAVTREYALICHGRLVSIARGEQAYFSVDGIATATEGCRSNALMRCCKDLGIASELWDPRWIRKFKAKYAREVFVEHVVNKRKTKIWVRKDDGVSYPWKTT